MRLIFRSKWEIQTFQGGCFPMGRAVFNFSQKIGLKTTKKVRFCKLHKTMGGARATLLATLPVIGDQEKILTFCT